MKVVRLSKTKIKELINKGNYYLKLELGSKRKHRVLVEHICLYFPISFLN